MEKWLNFFSLEPNNDSALNADAAKFWNKEGLFRTLTLSPNNIKLSLNMFIIDWFLFSIQFTRRNWRSLRGIWQQNVNYLYVLVNCILVSLYISNKSSLDAMFVVNRCYYQWLFEIKEFPFLLASLFQKSSSSLDN